jgi:glycosyltransferase involved in cell wall biosynthesis
MMIRWDDKFTINEAMVVYKSCPEGFSPRVTIGMPTFKRTSTLRRALASVARQTFRDFLLVVSDNGGRDPATMEAIAEVGAEIPAVVLVAQIDNLGAIGNLSYLLSVAQTEYFMWLADDDEITENYLAELVMLLESDKRTVAAMGYWKSMTSPTLGCRHTQSHHDQQSRTLRAMRYVTGPTDDSLFYGVHRTEYLRRCRFEDYLPPNRGVLTNFCYVFLFDQILLGPIAYSDNAGWICHNYSEKHYITSTALGVTDRFKTLLRRINVYALYCAKAFQQSPLLLSPILVASVFGLLRDVVTASARILHRKISRETVGSTE